MNLSHCKHPFFSRWLLFICFILGGCNGVVAVEENSNVNLFSPIGGGVAHVKVTGVEKVELMQDGKVYICGHKFRAKQIPSLVSGSSHKTIELSTEIAVLEGEEYVLVKKYIKEPEYDQNVRAIIDEDKEFNLERCTSMFSGLRVDDIALLRIVEREIDGVISSWVVIPLPPKALSKDMLSLTIEMNEEGLETWIPLTEIIGL